MTKTLISSTIHQPYPMGLMETLTQVARWNPSMKVSEAERIAGRMLELAQQYRIGDGTFLDGYALGALYREATGRTEPAQTVEDLRALGFAVSAPLAAVK